MNANPLDPATMHNMVTDILMRSFMPKSMQSQMDEPHVILVRRGVATVTDEILAIVEQYYVPEKE